ncbi:MAG: hypothetical protein ACOX9E_14315 [Lentisphaeria bacterium]|jgi:hypothetical protein
MIIVRRAFIRSILTLCLAAALMPWLATAQEADDVADAGDPAAAPQTRVINSQEVNALYMMCKGAETLYWHPFQQKVLYVAKLPLFSPSQASGSLATLRAKALHVVEGKGLMINSQGKDYLVICDDPAAPLYNNNIFVGVVSPRGSDFAFTTEDNREITLPILDLCDKASREVFNTFMLQGGSVTLQVPRKVATEVPCKKCKGSGKLGKDTRETITCKFCGGAGQVEGLNNTRRRCAGCGGTGKRGIGQDLRRQCGDCGGHGKYDEISFVNEDLTFTVGME